MQLLLELIILLAGLSALAYWRLPRLIWVPAALGLFMLAFFTSTLSLWISLPLFVLFIGVSMISLLPQLRQRLLSQPLLSYLHRALPPMSETERVALEAGDVWLDKSLFQGKVPWKAIKTQAIPSLNKAEQAFLDNEVETLCGSCDDWETISEHHDLSPEVWAYIKKQGFFGLIIPKQYGGKDFSAKAHSAIVAKLATRSISLAVTVMVPNSLGPGELLMKYGTEAQKNHYLPRLARGDEIPCFALTSPHAGSDASSIPDIGMVCEKMIEGKKTLGVKVTFDKHYITLAPVASLIGLAFHLRDPDGLIGKQKDIGITLALIPRDTKGLEIGQRHNPLLMAFMNGSLRGKDVFIPMDTIIGGQEKLGQGWQMLMECLAIGRGISLPSLVTAGAKHLYRTTGAYARMREQFGVPIGQFEGVEKALADIGGFTYMMEAMRKLSAHAVDLGHKPALMSGIAKYHLTEMGRNVINHAMDIHGGRGIQCGPSNYLSTHYISMPISITVEGANILTRNLIIFGQGAMRCHPYLQDEIKAAHAGDIQLFDKFLLKHIGYSSSNAIKTLYGGLTGGYGFWVNLPKALKPYGQNLQRMSSALAFTADIAMLFLGGALKRKESLSARLGDVLSYLLLSSATLKYYYDNGRQAEDSHCLAWALQYCAYHTQAAFLDFLDNFPNQIIARTLKIMIFPWGAHWKKPSDKLTHLVAKQMLMPSDFRERLTAGCYTGQPGDAVADLEQAFVQAFELHDEYKAFTRAVRSHKIDFYASMDKQLESAILQNIITKEQADKLKVLLALKDQLVRVDEFTSKSNTAEKQTA